MSAQDPSDKVGIMFGRERHGLYNDELALADTMVTIPTFSHFTSLNLAQAVNVMGYEVPYSYSLHFPYKNCSFDSRLSLYYGLFDSFGTHEMRLPTMAHPLNGFRPRTETASLDETNSIISSSDSNNN